MMAFDYESRTYRINPYICSTDDFTEEHAYLQSEIFPQLRKLCRDRGASFLPVHWDQNLAQDKLDKGQALYLALESINAASPFFIGLIGNQYGCHRPDESAPLSKEDVSDQWIDKNILTAASRGYRWILDESYNSASLFELKIIQAAFLSEETRFCRFYVRERDGGHVDRFDKFKLQQLKTSIAKRGLHVSYYKQLPELGENVLSNWREIINLLYPPLDTSRIGFQLIVDGVYHRRYGEVRCESLVMHQSVKECFDALTEFSEHTNDYTYDPFTRAKSFERSTGIRLLRKGRKKTHLGDRDTEADHKSICVLSGPRGSGKTALVSGWVSSQCEEVIPPHTAVVCHYAGCDRMARDVAVFMKRCIAELRKAFAKHYDDQCSMDSEYAEFSEIRETFLASLALGPNVIIFDGLDEISATMGHSMTEIKGMEWLPELLPPTSKFIFTVTDSDLAAKALRKRRDVMFLPHSDLDTEECKISILNEYLSHSLDAPILSDSHITQLTSFKLSASPIYLYMMANEIRDTNVYRDLQTHLDVYADCDSVSTSTRDMWTNLIKRWVRDYSWTRYRDDVMSEQAKSERLEDTVICGWVPDILRLIACSRNGLTVDEILGTLLYGMGYMGKRAVTLYDWTLFYNAAKCVFYEKPNGLIIINHEHFMEVVDFLLLGNISPPALHETSTDFQSIQRQGGMERRQYHISLASHLLSKPAEEQLQRVEEILWQLEIANDYMRLCNILLIPSVMDRMHGSLYCTYTPHRIELIRFYRLLKAKNVDFSSKVISQLDKLGFMSNEQNDEREMEPDADAYMSVAEPHSAAYSQLSRSDYEMPPDRQAWNDVEIAEDITKSKFITAAASSCGSEILSVYTRQMSAAQSQLSLQSDEAGRWVNHTPRPQSTRPSQVKESDTADNATEEEYPNVDPETIQSSNVLLISKSCSPAEVMQLALTCCKLLMVVDTEYSAVDILIKITKWFQQRYPLTEEELYVLFDVYEQLALYNTEREKYDIALEQLTKAHDCVQDISIDDETTSAMTEKLRSYMKAKLKLSMSGVCIRSNQRPLAQNLIDEAKIGMEELNCVPGINYALYKLALLRSSQQSYINATSYLSKCLEYFELWFGTMHPVVAEVCHSLGKLLSEDDNRETSDYVMAEDYLWKALNIRRERGLQSLPAAESLFHLAFLIQKQGSKTRKKEAVELLEDCLDIRTNKLGSEHESTRLVVYLLNDLEISLQLGQYEFGMAKPTDHRSGKLPFSLLSMHEKALIEHNQNLEKIRRPKTTQGGKQAKSNRPQSAFTIDNPRSESRLHKALTRRPKTAPTKFDHTYIHVDKHHVGGRSYECTTPKSLGDSHAYNHIMPESELSSESNSPRTYRSMNRDNMHAARDGTGAPSRLSTYSYRSSVLERYSNVTRGDGDRAVSRVGAASRATTKSHKCHDIGPHTIHKNLTSVTDGPNSTIYSVAGHMPPSVHKTPVHQSAWYHLPNHYATVHKPYINQRVYAQKKKSLMHQRSQSSPLHSRFMNDHTNAIHHIAQYESSYA